MKTLVVKKEELPIPVIVQDRHGEEMVYELAPASPKKLGASLRRVDGFVKQLIRDRMKKG